MPDHPVILFDGICNLCNASVQFVIKHDPRAIFKFTTQQSETGRMLMKEHGITFSEMNTFILIKDKKVFSRSTAALMVAKQLNGIIKILYGFILVPPFIRNSVYNFISKNRYSWFGKKNSCMIPAPGIKDRFLN